MSRWTLPDPDDQGPAILKATWVLVAFSIIVIILRIVVRLSNARRLDFHDYFMILALIFQVGSQTCVTKAYDWGLGKHQEFFIMDPSMGWIEMIKWVYISTIPGVLCSIAARISICLLLISLFGTKVWLKWWLIVNTLCVGIFGALSIVLTWAQSNPVEGLWNPLIPAKRWNPQIPFVFVAISGSIFALTDLTFALFPVFIIWKLNMALHRKLGLCILMAGSLFGVVTCVMRIVTYRDEDLSHIGNGMLWASIEQSLVVILGSVPTLPALFKMEAGFLRSWGSSLSSLVHFTSLKRSYGSASVEEHQLKKSGRGDSEDDLIRLRSREVRTGRSLTK